MSEIYRDISEAGKELQDACFDSFAKADLTDADVWDAAWRLVQRAKKAKSSPGGVLRNGLATFKQERLK